MGKQSGTGGTGSSMRNSKSIEEHDTASAEYIKELQAEIDRLTAGTGMRSKYNTHEHRRSEGKLQFQFVLLRRHCFLESQLR